METLKIHGFNRKGEDSEGEGQRALRVELGLVEVADEPFPTLRGQYVALVTSRLVHGRYLGMTKGGHSAMNERLISILDYSKLNDGEIAGLRIDPEVGYYGGLVKSIEPISREEMGRIMEQVNSRRGLDQKDSNQDFSI